MSSDLPRCSVMTSRKADAWCGECGLPFSGRFLSMAIDGRAVCRRCRHNPGVILLLNEESSLRRRLLGLVRTPLALLRAPTATLRLLSETRGLSPLLYAWAWLSISYAAWSAWLSRLAPESIPPTLQELLANADASGPTLEVLVNDGWILVFPSVAFLRLVMGVTTLLASAHLVGMPHSQRPRLVNTYAISQAAFLLTFIPTFVGPLLAGFAWSLLMVYGTSHWTLGKLVPTLLLVMPVGILQLLLGPAPLG